MVFFYQGLNGAADYGVDEQPSPSAQPNGRRPVTPPPQNPHADARDRRVDETSSFGGKPPRQSNHNPPRGLRGACR
ncbi:hypothetical protein ACFLV5_04335 [Chloroflexota bacterium]